MRPKPVNALSGLRWSSSTPRGARRARGVRRVLVVVFALVALPALASDAEAPTDQYEQFDKDATEIKDQKTLLAWERAVIPAGPQATALSHCAGRASRIPTVKELLTIVAEEPHSEYEFGREVPKMIDRGAFPRTPVDRPYFSSTSTSPSGSEVWGIDFSTGEMVRMDGSASGNVRCVK